MPDTLQPGYRVRDLARLLRVGRARILTMIRNGELPAVDVGTPGRPRFVVLPAQLDQFVRGRQAATPPLPRRRKRLPVVHDFYPD
jgi:excisionase family DNA binding protein